MYAELIGNYKSYRIKSLQDNNLIIDSDYYCNESNDGEIMFQLINLSPYDIQLRKGDRIGQGIIKQYSLVEGDNYYTGEKRKGGFGSTSNQQQDFKEYLPKTIVYSGNDYSIQYQTTTTTNTAGENYIASVPYTSDINLNLSQKELENLQNSLI